MSWVRGIKGSSDIIVAQELEIKAINQNLIEIKRSCDNYRGWYENSVEELNEKAKENNELKNELRKLKMTQEAVLAQREAMNGMRHTINALKDELAVYEKRSGK